MHSRSATHELFLAKKKAKKKKQFNSQIEVMRNTFLILFSFSIHIFAKCIPFLFQARKAREKEQPRLLEKLIFSKTVLLKKNILLLIVFARLYQGLFTWAAATSGSGKYIKCSLCTSDKERRKSYKEYVGICRCRSLPLPL